jgi:hypothetical protein
MLTFIGRHDAQHNAIKHNYIQHKGLGYVRDTRHNNTLSVEHATLKLH